MPSFLSSLRRRKEREPRSFPVEDHSLSPRGHSANATPTAAEAAAAQQQATRQLAAAAATSEAMQPIPATQVQPAAAAKAAAATSKPAAAAASPAPTKAKAKADAPRSGSGSASGGAAKKRGGGKGSKGCDDIGLKDFVIPLFIGLGFVLVIAWFAELMPGFQTPDALKPIGGKKVKWIGQFQGQYRDRMLWGTYRPGYYFGARYRMPMSLLAGLMWYDPAARNALSKLRHEARQEDGLERYGWLRHDGMTYGSQELLDGRYNITATWVKRLPNPGPYGAPALPRGGDWALNVRVEPYADPFDEYEDDEDEDVDKKKAGGSAAQAKGDERIALVFYLADEMAPDWRGHAVSVMPGGPLPAGSTGGVVASGKSFPVDKWALHVNDNTGGHAIKGLSYGGVATTQFANLTAILRENVQVSVHRAKGQAQATRKYKLPNDVADAKPSVAFLQVSAKLPIDLDFTFVAGVPDESEDKMRARVRGALKSVFGPLKEKFGIDPLRHIGIDLGDGSPEDEAAVAATAGERAAALQGARLKELAAERAAAFEAHFSDVFSRAETGNVPKDAGPALRAALSNLLGGMGFWYGASTVRYTATPGGNPKEGQLQETGLFSAVPSRSFFPRGFLWDEGFHQLLVQRWSPLVSRDVIAHWLDLMTSDGWIPREQILGDEARSRVPTEFVTQDPLHANPPTLFLPLLRLAANVAKHAADLNMPQGSPQWLEGEFLAAAYWRLKNWVDWYLRTQAGPTTGAYRWHGRDATTVMELNPKTLASGLDDYPRASHPSDDERHLDLRCWLALASRAMVTVGRAIGWDEKEVDRYDQIATTLEDFALLNELHWDEGRQMYLDWGNHTEEVKLERVYYRDARGGVHPAHMQRLVSGTPTPQLVPQFGYNSLFPLLAKLLPADSLHLGATLRHMRDPDQLWTPYGLRSLSAATSIYRHRNTEHDPPYWRGPIWMNVNYMACAALHHYSSVEGPHKQLAADIYAELRANLLGNVVGQYRRTGYLWENYDDRTGKGQFSHPFTGWTATVLLIAGELYY